jgi:hypothetical protein
MMPEQHRCCATPVPGTSCAFDRRPLAPRGGLDSHLRAPTGTVCAVSTLEHAPPALAPAGDDHSRLRRELDRFDTVFFLISAMVVVDTIGAIAIGGAQAFTCVAGIRHRRPERRDACGFEGQRLQFELLVLTPVAVVAVLACVFYRLGARAS